MGWELDIEGCISYFREDWPIAISRRIVLGFEGEKNMPKLNFSGYLPNTPRNDILKLPIIPAGAFSNIQDGVQDGRQNVNTAI